MSSSSFQRATSVQARCYERFYGRENDGRRNAVVFPDFTTPSRRLTAPLLEPTRRHSREDTCSFYIRSVGVNSKYASPSRSESENLKKKMVGSPQRRRKARINRMNLLLRFSLLLNPRYRVRGELINCKVRRERTREKLALRERTSSNLQLRHVRIRP